MRTGVQRELERMVERHAEIERLLAEPDVIQDQDRFRELSQEYARHERLVERFGAWQETAHALAEAREMAAGDDAEMSALAAEEVTRLDEQLQALEAELQELLIPDDPRDNADIYLEIRAGTGGDEAALFAGDLLRMYMRYAEQHKWQVELLSEQFGEQGGYREVIARIGGRGVFSRLKFESGTHRVQRVPETESQGRIHTSAATVAVLPVPDAVEAATVNPADLRIDTYRASGAGGQHVNKTDSAVRMTHLPTGIVIECQDERSQHKNRATALAFLEARLTAEREAEQAAEQDESRRLQVGSGDRSERIRTYNFPQGRLTDHRINLTLYQLESIVAGDLDPVIDPLLSEHQARELTRITQDP